MGSNKLLNLLRQPVLLRQFQTVTHMRHDDACAAVGIELVMWIDLLVFRKERRSRHLADVMMKAPTRTSDALA